ncbi:hypothetical protein E0H51_31555 [Rhizobium leguminosarum bv. viciae]|uniref:hypothetical protein n=1 Tax=Rhizobium leguminosarum TaxID=384 RepID=UPI0010402DDF|nr:hypothetical protein [Rhizobium leguminosarum]TBY68947.1 hypothetical protein E0H51_31555 [Rhizobium leguminosarum bv. viciae]
MTSDRFILRRLAFTGPDKELRDLDFAPGLTVVWGGSQAGKSFAVKALDYMFGSGAALPVLKETIGYERCWLELDLPKSGRVTLARSLSKGGYDLFGGTIDSSLGRTGNRTLAENHGAKRESLSSFLLGELGIGDVQIARTLSGDKATFTIRHFATYMFTEETPMIAEESPITLDRQSSDTFNKNVLKYILTGVDDRSIVQVPDVKQQKQTNAGRIEIVEEMLNAAVAELAAMYPGIEDLETLKLQEQSERLDDTLATFKENLAARHSFLDALARERRLLVSERDELIERADEIVLTIDRFKLLATSYASDIRRLIALEEGAAALMVGARRTCILCGADPAHQHVEHGFEAVETSQKAVNAELRKVRGESAGLVKATASLEAELLGMQRRIAALDQEIGEKNDELDSAKLTEVRTREEYESIDQARKKLHDAIMVERRISSLRVRHAELSKFKAKSAPRGSIVAGVGTVVGDELAAAVEKIFHAWRYPGNPRITFHDKTHDILLNGSQRNANGKGVRALLNAAFKIGVMDVCRQRDLPHPGIIALDSPLLSYRDPLKSKHKELSEDEEILVATDLKVHFYNYLIERSNDAQFLIMENQDPPFALPSGVREHIFAGQHATDGRKGLF